MKKILYLLTIILSLSLLMSCQEPETIDVVPPNIVGTANIDYRIGDELPDYMANVSAYDNVDGNISTSIVVDDSEVDLTTVGVYTLTYTVEDSSGNQDTKTISVTVIPGSTGIDVNAPVILGFGNIDHRFGDDAPNYLEGLTAFDPEDGYITEDIQVDSSLVNLNVLGVYDVTYVVEDQARNSFSVTVSLRVYDDVDPVFTGVDDMTYIMGDPLPDFEDGVMASDDYDGDLTANILINSQAFDDWFPGIYPITYRVTDSSGNQTIYTRYITVLDDVLPVISNTSNITLPMESATPDYLTGVTAYDNVDGYINQSITVDDSRVNYAFPGTYEVTYRVTDSSGNIGTATIIVTIYDNVLPVITGAVSINHTMGDETPDLLLGVTASDNVDGDLTSEIIIVGSVNYDLPGIYTITYEVVDAANNQASVSISVTVIDPNPQSTIDQLNVYYINDTHGSILESEDEMGMSKIGNLILNEKVARPENTLFIGGGDLLQGSILSNYFNGASMIEILNMMELDAFVIGNHEFDWGFDIVTSYRDPQNPLLTADFPLLGANIFYAGTETRPDYIDPYTIVQKGNISVGIIGLIGYGLESSIATSRVAPYEFDNPQYWAAYYTEYLRTTENVDMVLVVIHDGNYNNQTFSTWTGDQKIDAVFNGHTHQAYTTMFSRTGVDMPAIQSASNGKVVGKVSFDLDINGNITDATAVNLTGTTESRLTMNHPGIDAIIEGYYNQIEPLINEVIIYSGEYYSTSALTYYMAKLMRLATGADIAYHNQGGTRDSIASGEGITVAKLFKIFPFDNRIKTVYLYGSEINSFSLSYDKDPSITTFDDNTLYKVATNDYVFDQTTNPFIYGEDIVDTGILIRDVLETALRNQADLGLDFYTSNPINLN